MRHETRVRLLALLLLAACLAASGLLSVRIAASAGQARLSYTDRAEDGDPPAVALGIAMGAFRGIFVNYLWIRATDAKEDGKYFEAVELARAITRLQPRFPRVWVFHAWNLAYNISVTTQTPEERWQWVNAGVRLLRDEGLRSNPNDMLMHKELGWIFLHKIGGYTDDSNMYYKRQVAAEWQSVLGLPPRPSPDARTREARVQRFVDWLRPIVDAPATMAGLRQRSPAAADLADRLTSGIDEPLGADTLRRYAFHDELVRRGRLESERPRLGAKGAVFEALASDPALADAWTDLIAFLRRRVLVEDYNMEPLRMLRLTQDYGPIDWRMPAAHGLYWSTRGIEVGQIEVNERDSDSFDFVNTYRVALQSLQDLWRFGDLYFNYLDIAQGRQAYYQPMPNPDFIESYDRLMAESVEGSGIFEAKKRPYRVTAAGYENFLTDAVLFFYRRGDYDEAEKWYTRVRTFSGQNIHDFQRVDKFSMPLDEFVTANLWDRRDSPNIAVQEVAGALQGAFLEGLLLGDTERFEGMFDYARKAHRFYMDKQFREVVAAGAQGRTEYMDRDFRFLSGNVFANMLPQFPPDEAELMYGNAPEDLRRFAYDTVLAVYRPVFTQLGRGEDPADFDLAFPPPAGMDAFRAWYRAQLQARQDRSVEGLRSN